MSTTSQEKDITQTYRSTSAPKSRIASQPSRPAWALAWSRGESIAPRPGPHPPFPPSSYQSSNPNTTPLNHRVPSGWDDDEDDVKPQLVTPTLNNALPAAIAHPPINRPSSRPSSRLSDHLTQDQQDRQAMSNDMAGRRALPTIRSDLGLPGPKSQTAKEGVTSSAVTLHGWDDNDAASSTRKARSQTHIGPGYPRLEPSRVYEEMLQRETVRPPVFGGRSKNMQLGSVAESWGKPPTAETPRGMYQLDDDPPSPPPGVNMSPEEIQAEKHRRAMLGIPGEKSGRPSIKDMEKEIVDKMKLQKIREERVRSDVNVRDLRPADRASIQGSDWGQSARQNQPTWPPQRTGQDPRPFQPAQAQPFKQNQGQLPLSERLRERDVYGKGRKEDDGW